MTKLQRFPLSSTVSLRPSLRNHLTTIRLLDDDTIAGLLNRIFVLDGQGGQASGVNINNNNRLQYNNAPARQQYYCCSTAPGTKLTATIITTTAVPVRRPKVTAPRRGVTYSVVEQLQRAPRGVAPTAAAAAAPTVPATVEGGPAVEAAAVPPKTPTMPTGIPTSATPGTG